MQQIPVKPPPGSAGKAGRVNGKRESPQPPPSAGGETCCIFSDPPSVCRTELSHVTEGRRASLLEETQSDQKQQPEQEMSCNIRVCCSASLSMNELQIHSNRRVRDSDPAHSQKLSLTNQSNHHQLAETEGNRHITIPSRPLMEPVSSFITNAVRDRLSRPPRPEQTCSSSKVH